MESLRDELICLIEKNYVSAENIDDAVTLTSLKPTANAWLEFINKLFLWIGCIAFGLSVIFFIAFNWSKMGRLAKFTLVELSLVLAIIAYIKAPLSSIVSSAALLFATLMLGALMALFGQAYQTGADPWQLFFNWALLMTPWAIIGRFTSLWIIWLVLLNLAIALYFEVHPNPFSLLFDSQTSLLWSLFAFNCLSFFAWYLLSQSFVWMQEIWAIRLIASGAGASITSLVLITIFDIGITNSLALPVWLLFFTIIYWLYRKLATDLFMLAGTCLAGILVTISLLAENILNANGAGPLLVLSVVVIGLGVGSAFWLKKVQVGSQL